MLFRDVMQKQEQAKLVPVFLSAGIKPIKVIIYNLPDGIMLYSVEYIPVDYFYRFFK